MNGNRNLVRQWAVGVAVLAAAFCGSARASETVDASVAPVMVAQASTLTTRMEAKPNPSTYPANQAGVRSAALQGPDALRRYIYRTRMIYGFYYNDFAIDE